MVDALVSGASALRHVGSSPILGTKIRVALATLIFLSMGQLYIQSLQTSL